MPLSSIKWLDLPGHVYLDSSVGQYTYLQPKFHSFVVANRGTTLRRLVNESGSSKIEAKSLQQGECTVTPSEEVVTSRVLRSGRNSS